ncbi:hypothetical protein FQN50_004749 [Emmonsiellopsis sp. PD_5]|nr:hypothetical protein FQN50_004749 [Emmonsiellopsis sp. PD_5]
MAGIQLGLNAGDPPAAPQPAAPIFLPQAFGNGLPAPIFLPQGPPAPGNAIQAQQFQAQQNFHAAPFANQQGGRGGGCADAPQPLNGATGALTLLGGAPNNDDDGYDVPPGALIPGTDEPLTLPGGEAFLFPSSLTTVRHILAHRGPWETPGIQLRYREFKVPTCLTLADFINVLANFYLPGGQPRTNAAVIETFELGNGMWQKGPEYWIGEGMGSQPMMKEYTKKTLEEIGWTKERPSILPIWIVGFLG